VSEQEVLESGHKIRELEERLEKQIVELGAKWRRIKRMKSGVWTIESVCPPFASLVKTFELQWDIFFLVYSQQSKQVLSTLDFKKMWAKSLMDGWEYSHRNFGKGRIESDQSLQGVPYYSQIWSQNFHI
jgi:hypothetical protein